MTAVVAQTKVVAKQLALELGIENPLIFGATMAAAFDGLRADRVLIDATAKIGRDFLDTIHATVLKTPGGIVRYLVVTPRPVRRMGVRVLGPFNHWLRHHGADGWHEDADGRLVVTAGRQRIATYNSWIAVDFVEGS